MPDTFAKSILLSSKTLLTTLRLMIDRFSHLILFKTSAFFIYAFESACIFYLPTTNGSDPSKLRGSIALLSSTNWKHLKYHTAPLLSMSVGDQTTVSFKDSFLNV